MDFRAWLLQALDDRGWTIARLAQEACVGNDGRVLYYLSAGKRQHVSAPTALRCAAVLAPTMTVSELNAIMNGERHKKENQ